MMRVRRLARAANGSAVLSSGSSTASAQTTVKVIARNGDACHGGGVLASFRYMIREKSMQNRRIVGLLCLAASCMPVTSVSAAAMEWNTLFEAASGPPYPSSGRVEFGLREGLLLPAVQRSLIQVGLENVICDGSVMPAAMLGGDNGDGAGIGPRASLAFSVGDAVGETLNIDILIEAFGDGSVRQGAVMQDFHFNTGAFSLMFDVMPGDGSVHKHIWLGNIVSFQPLELVNADAAVLGDGSVRLLLGLNRLPGNQILSEPVMAMSMSADFVPEPATAMLMGVASLLLRGRRKGSCSS